MAHLDSDASSTGVALLAAAVVFLGAFALVHVFPSDVVVLLIIVAGSGALGAQWATSPTGHRYLHKRFTRASRTPNTVVLGVLVVSNTLHFLEWPLVLEQAVQGAGLLLLLGVLWRSHRTSTLPPRSGAQAK